MGACGCVRIILSAAGQGRNAPILAEFWRRLCRRIKKLCTGCRRRFWRRAWKRADRMELLKYMLLSATSLFVIIDPIATVPAFLAMTPKDGPEARIRMARLACVIAACILMTFVLTGQTLFRFMGITIPAFKIAGSIVLLLVALDMLRARRSAVKETMEETYAAAEKEDIAITPLAVPMLAGPGAISTTVLLHTQSPDF